jgi:hypothetical protein
VELNPSMKKQTYVAKSKIAWWFKLYALLMTLLCSPFIIYSLMQNKDFGFLFPIFTLFVLTVLLILIRSRVEVYDDLVFVNTVFRSYTVYFSQIHYVKENRASQLGSIYLFYSTEKKILFALGDAIFSNAESLKDTITKHAELYKHNLSLKVN